MRATIQAVQPYQLHGVLYYHLEYVPDGQEQPRAARVPHEAAYPDPQPGDRVDVSEILGIVDRVSRVEQ
ncbi:MAG: hypothetical protein WD734_02925 [Dehalococcoidia bacterium]